MILAWTFVRRRVPRFPRGSRGLAGELEIDLGFIQIDPHDLDADLVAETVNLARALAHEAMLGGIEMIIVVAEPRDVHEAIHIHHHQFDKYTEAGHAADVAVELLTDPVHHELSLEPARYLASGLIGASFS